MHISSLRLKERDDLQVWVEIKQGGLKCPEIISLVRNYLFVSPLNIFFSLKKNRDNFLAFFLIVKILYELLQHQIIQRAIKKESKYDSQLFHPERITLYVLQRMTST